jgi:hypothetical protein
MPYLGGTITNTTGVGIWNASARTPGVLQAASADVNGNWIWDPNVLGVKFVGQPLQFGAVNYISKTVNIPPPNQPDGGVWMTVALELDPNRPQPTTCFVKNAMVTLHNGSEKPISDVVVGDHVLGHNGEINQVIGLDRTILGDRLLYSLNGGDFFVTAEHPFYIEEIGWVSIDPNATLLENPDLRVNRLTTGNAVVKLMLVLEYEKAHRSGEVLLADKAKLLLNSEVITKINSKKADYDEPLFNLLLDGNNTYFVNKYLVHNKGDH